MGITQSNTTAFQKRPGIRKAKFSITDDTCVTDMESTTCTKLTDTVDVTKTGGIAKKDSTRNLRRNTNDKVKIITVESVEDLE